MAKKNEVTVLKPSNDVDVQIDVFKITRDDLFNVAITHKEEELNATILALEKRQQELNGERGILYAPLKKGFKFVEDWGKFNDFLAFTSRPTPPKELPHDLGPGAADKGITTDILATIIGHQGRYFNTTLYHVVTQEVKDSVKITRKAQDIVNKLMKNGEEDRANFADLCRARQDLGDLPRSVKKMKAAFTQQFLQSTDKGRQILADVKNLMQNGMKAIGDGK